MGIVANTSQTVRVIHGTRSVTRPTLAQNTILIAKIMSNVTDVQAIAGSAMLDFVPQAAARVGCHSATCFRSLKPPRPGVPGGVGGVTDS